jgi:hypothetical protein
MTERVERVDSYQPFEELQNAMWDSEEEARVPELELRELD